MASKKYKSVRVKPINEIFQIDFWLGNFFVTKDLRIFGAIELNGFDADALGPNEHYSMAKLADSIYSNVPDEVTVTQYYINHTDAKVSLKRRPEQEYSDLLSQSRAEYLNSKPLTEGRLFQFFEIPLNNDLNKLSLLSLVRTLITTLTDIKNITNLKQRFSIRDSLFLYRSDIDAKINTLKDTMENVVQRWAMMFDGYMLSRDQITPILTYLTTFRSESLVENISIPERDGGSYLNNGRLRVVNVKNEDVIKTSDVDPKYLQISSITSIGENPLMGFWFVNDQSLGNQVGNYVICFRFKKMNALQKSMFFKSTEDDLTRANLNIVHLATGKEMDYQEKQSRMSEDHRKKFKELDQAKAQSVGWCYSNAYVLTHAKDIDTLKKESKVVNNALKNSGVKYVSESIGLMRAYESMYPTGGNKPGRRLITNSKQNAVLSLHYKPLEGSRYNPDLRDEALFIYETPPGRPLYYSPFVDGRGLVIGIGPTRSGKTYAKNTVSSHFFKYGGELVDIDIDPGSEIIAKSMGENGSIFSVDDSTGEGGFNLFSTYDPKDRSRFISHLNQQLMRMLKSNEEEAMRTLEDGEQMILDNAIKATLDTPKHMHTLSHLVGHLPSRLKRKFARWVRDANGDTGKYAGFSDCIEDGVGGLETQHKVFNLLKIKENEELLRIAYPEIFYRLIKRFEDPEKRGIPKGVQIDECHAPLKDPYFVDSIVKGVRTWNKFLVYIALWTHSPEELRELKHWSAVRSAASTFIFMADSTMSEEVYMDTFKITAGECEAIRTLKPRSEAYIIQRDLGISKKVILNNDPVMHAVATSHPKETPLRDELIEEHGYMEGIQIAAKEIEKLGIQEDLEDDSEEVNLISDLQKNYYSD